MMRIIYYTEMDDLLILVKRRQIQSTWFEAIGRSYLVLTALISKAEFPACSLLAAFNIATDIAADIVSV